MPEPTGSIRRVVVVHGYTATPERHWFGWLAHELGRHGITVDIPALPDSSAPHPRVWRERVQQQIGTPAPQTAVVAHSLGAITALRALDQTPGVWSLGSFVAVSGFDELVPAFPELDGFLTALRGPRPIDYQRLRAQIVDRFVLTSDNDPEVPPAATHRLATRLVADTLVVPGGGHFMGSEGSTSLPAVADRIRGL